MQPTVHHGDYLLVERISIMRGRYKKGDVVVAEQPRVSHTLSHVLKRIKGMGYDHVTFREDAQHAMVTREVPADHVWLEGDNSVHSLDSRTYGPVPVARLEYRVLLRLWPLDRFGRLTSLTPPNPSEPCPSVPYTSVESCSDRDQLNEQ